MFDRFNLWVGSLIARTQDLKNESGQTFVEYALVLSVIVVGVLLLATWTGLAGGIEGAIKAVTDKLPADPTPTP
jgi:Flp pilus assembly pilin Flp